MIYKVGHIQSMTNSALKWFIKLATYNLWPTQLKIYKVGQIQSITKSAKDL